MNYGFVIDNRKCIGCHACSTACKSENEVPLGVARTWVKYTEVGQYPDVRRHFQVTRCNHCANPPCVRICPVTAMYQREDGIVEFDSNVCIGCKACMQACPYDAIHIDPETKTAAKCHYCAHRTDIGLEPACVVVCPEHAIIAGDMDDPQSEISHVIAGNSVTVRKPEQGTAPKLFYIDGHDASLTPTATAQKPQNFMWSQENSEQWKGALHHFEGPTAGAQLKAQSGTNIRTPQTQGHPQSGPIKVSGGTVAEQMVQVVYNFQHKVPWHWPVPAYLVTKGVATGLFMILAAYFVLNPMSFDPLAATAGGLTSVIFTLITTALLVYDLERPERFLRIIFRPQMKSWLTRGAFLLIAFSTLSAIWWMFEAAQYWGWLHLETPLVLRLTLLILAIPLAFGAAIYTAFLFGQAEGRDLWQTPLLPAHLTVQAIMAGSGALLVLGAFIAVSDELSWVNSVIFNVSVAVDLLIILLGEFGMPHSSEVAAQAAHKITHGEYRIHFWVGAILLGHVAPLWLAWAGSPVLGALAGLTMLIGLYFYEYAFVMAAQKIPNS